MTHRDPPAREKSIEQLALLVQEFTAKVESSERYTVAVTRKSAEFADRAKPLPEKPPTRVWKTRERGYLEQLRVGSGERPAVRVRGDQVAVIAWCSVKDRKVRHAIVLAEPLAASALLSAGPTSAVIADAAAAEERSTSNLSTEGRIRGTTGRSRKPGSRPPGSLNVLEEFTLIVAGIAQMRRDLRRKTGRTAGERKSPARALSEIVDLMRELDGRGDPLISDDVLERAVRQLR